MNREGIIFNALQRGNRLNISNKWYKEHLEQRVMPLINDDFDKGDITTDLLIKRDFPAKAVVYARQDGIIAGIEEVRFLYGKFGIEVANSVKDGIKAKSGDKLLELKGSVKTLFKIERRLLDILSRMSGIATMTCLLRQLVNNNISVSATRKTLFPYIDKKAVFIGGGLTHRLALWDGVLIKNNHIFCIDFGLMDKSFFSMIDKQCSVVELETKDKDSAISLLRNFIKYRQANHDSDLVIIVMFDNMKPSDIKEGIDKIRGISKTEIADSVLFEASGNITEKNINEYAHTGIDVISVGMLTHSVKGFDLNQKIMKIFSIK